jgi:tetratricopeptide (TPR) repeat protein
VGWKRWAARVVAMIAAPLVFFAVLEAALRLGGFGYPAGFLLRSNQNGRALLVQNNQFGYRFFGARMARLPAPIAMPAPKAPGTIRIFVLGESAAFGDPQPKFGLPRMLEAMLELRHPGTKFEVVNAAMTGINSHAILPIARACARAEGDVWVVYMGNNEVIGPFGAGTVFGPQVPPLPLIRANLAAKATRTGQLLDAFRQSLQKTPPEKSEWGGMMMFLNQRVPAADARMAGVYHNFRKNLDDIIRAGRESGAGVVVSTVAVNLRDCAPFSSLHRKDLTETQVKQWEELFRSGVEAQGVGNWGGAQKQFRAAGQLDDAFAEVRFRLGQCALALKEPEEARTEFAAARDLDTLRFRCDSQLNESIRQTAMNREVDGVFFADSEHALASASEDGLPGAKYFYEHVHLTFEGNYLVAQSICEQVEKLLGAKVSSSSLRWPELSECARRLGWTSRARQGAVSEMLGRLIDPPFTLQSNHAAQLQRLGELARTMPPADSPPSLKEAQAACDGALAKWPEDALLYQQLAEIDQKLEDDSGSAAAANRSLDLLPGNQECWLILGMALVHQQKFEEAAVAFRHIFELDPQDVWGRQNLALCWEKLGRRDEAILEFKRALAIKPRFGLAWLGLGRVYEEMGRQQEAEDCYHRGVTNRIHRPDELATLARFCQSRGWLDAAVTNYADAITLSPSHPGLRFEAGQVLAALGRHEEAAQRFAEAIQLSPNQGQAHFLRGLELGRLNKPGEAEQEFQEATKLLPDVVEARINLGIALYQQGKLDKALEQFETVLQRSPTNSVALKYMQTMRSGAKAE